MENISFECRELLRTAQLAHQYLIFERECRENGICCVPPPDQIERRLGEAIVEILAREGG